MRDQIGKSRFLLGGKRRRCLQRGRCLLVCRLMWAGLRAEESISRSHDQRLGLPPLPPPTSHRTEVGAAFYDGVSCTTGRAAESMTAGQENHGESVVVCLSMHAGGRTRALSDSRGGEEEERFRHWAGSTARLILLCPIICDVHYVRLQSAIENLGISKATKLPGLIICR